MDARIAAPIAAIVHRHHRAQAAPMQRLIALSLALVASSASAQSAGRLPTQADVVEAYRLSIQRLCEALIDQCDEMGPVVPTSPGQIEALACSGRATTATCYFRLFGDRCRARFILDRVDGDRRWTVQRRPARFYGRPQVACRTLPPT